METLIGRLATDPLLRRRFADDPIAVLGEFQREGYELTAVELDALASTDSEAIRSFSQTIDRRLRKADHGTDPTSDRSWVMTNATIETSDGRTVGFADYGTPDQIAVLWCHGGPGNRLEPAFVADAASRAGMRLVGIDRPGYGRSTPQPGRTIGGWVSDAIAVVDHLGIERFVVAGMSTGGAYALAVASHTSRVIAAVACGAVSDMRWPEGKAMNVCCHPFWHARNRDEAVALAITMFGEHGELLLPPHGGQVAADPCDGAFMATPAAQSWWSSCVPEMFRQGVAGYVDDRLADRDGWGSFDVAHIACPVTVLHGASDGLIPVANARHTAAIVPGATLHIAEHLGHLSGLTKVVETIGETLARCAVTR